MQIVHQSRHLLSCRAKSKSAPKIIGEEIFVNLTMATVIMCKGAIVQCAKCRDVLGKNLASRVRIKWKGMANESIGWIDNHDDRDNGCLDIFGEPGVKSDVW